MSQFGYAEEPGENKARADIYAVIPPLLISPGIWRLRRARVTACCTRKTIVALFLI